MNWINWTWIGGGLLGSLIVGLIIGRIVAGIKYPNPDKPHIFTPKQSVIILVGVVVAVALIVFAVLYQPKPKNGGEDLMPSGMPSGMDGMMEPNGALPMDDTGLEEGTAEPADTQLDEEDLTEGGTAEDGSESEIEGDGINANPET